MLSALAWLLRVITLTETQERGAKPFAFTGNAKSVRSAKTQSPHVYSFFFHLQFVEDEGEVVFYKNAKGIAQRQAVFSSDGGISDSGVDLQ